MNNPIPPTPSPTTKLPAAEWVKFFERGDVLTKELADVKSARAKAIKIGQFLSSCLGREVGVEAGGRAGRARLRVEEGRANKKLYSFEIVWDAAPELAGDPAVASLPPTRTGTSITKRETCPSPSSMPTPAGRAPSLPGGNDEQW